MTWKLLRPASGIVAWIPDSFSCKLNSTQSANYFVHRTADSGHVRFASIGNVSAEKRLCWSRRSSGFLNRATSINGNFLVSAMPIPG